MALKQLSGLDSAFLYLETADTPMHVGSLHLLALPAGQRGSFATRVRAHLKARLGLAAPLTRVLRRIPLDLMSPHWEHEPAPDLRFHVQGLRLPAPGGRAELETLVGQLHGELMDRGRPLWQMFVIEGLGPELQFPGMGRSVALYSKVHHAAVDGQGAIAMASALLDLAPGATTPPKGRRRPRVSLGLAEVLSGALSNQWAQATQLASSLPRALGALSQGARQSGSPAVGAGNRRKDQAWLRERLPLAPRTRFNRAVRGERAFASARLPLPEVKALGKSHDASINDMVLAVIAGALREYLLARRDLPKQALVAAVPVSLRASGDATQNNQAALATAPLPTHLREPRKRLFAIRDRTTGMKRRLGGVRGVLPTDFPTLGLPWLVSGLSKLYARSRLADRAPAIANVAVSNVPGPQFPLYLAGARMLSYAPVSIVAQGLALNITVQSYDGGLYFGLTACRQTVPDTAELARGIERAWQELRDALMMPTTPRRAAARTATARPSRSRTAA
jgi:WS/DGAT/MGAT family acyltransferase